MFREPNRPVDALDAALVAAIAAGDRAALEPVRAHLSAELARALDQLLGNCLSRDGRRQTARLLAASGAVAAAATVLEMLAGEAAPVKERTAPLRDLAILEAAAGRRIAAEGHQRAVRRLAGEGNPTATLSELDDGGLFIAGVFGDERRYHDILAGPDGGALRDDPLRDPFTLKRTSTYDAMLGLVGGWEDYSFFVVDDDDGRPVLQVECDVIGYRYLGCRETGISLTAIRPDHPGRDAAEALALRQLDLICAWSGCPYVMIDVSAEAQARPAMTSHFAGLGDFEAIPYRLGWIDLDQDVAAIERGYRATTRHCIRWGRENMRVLRPAEVEGDFFPLYQEMHDAAPRRPPLSKDPLLAALAAGEVSAFLGFYQDRPVGLVLSSRHGRTTYDMAVVKVPLGKEPISHVLIHHAILDAKDQGQRCFHFGPLYESGHLGEKHKGIAKFKAGFASAYEKRLLIRMRV